MTGVLDRIRWGSGRRAARARDGGAALALTLFLIMLIGVLSLSIAAAVLVQTRPTQLQQKRTVTLGAAESGLAVALNKLRAASDPTRVYGLVNSLPCNDGTTPLVSGSVGSGAWNPSYQVYVWYYTSNPSAQSDSWRSTNAISCSAGHPSSTPLYALLKATGSGDAVPGQAATGASRTLETTYEFTVNNVNIPGGMLPIFASNAITTWCLSVDSAQLGQRVKVRTCQGLDTQKWSYTSDLLLQMQDSAGATYCMSIGSSSYVVLASCDKNNVSQIWGYDGSKQFEGATAVNGQLTGQCMYATALSDGSAIKYGGCGAQIIPDSAVGPGRAGEDMSQVDGTCRDASNNIVTTCTFQIVNYKYFGRCIDMTHQTVSSTWMIGYVCKETPGTQYIAWNQKFFWDATNGMFCTNTSGTTVTTCGTPSSSLYCLYDGTTSTNSTAGTRVLLKLCNRSDQSQLWGRTFDTGSYSSSWTIYTKREGLCLELSPNYPPEAGTIDQPWGMIIVNTCDGSTQQKWNAPPDLQTSALQNTFEHTS